MGTSKSKLNVIQYDNLALMLLHNDTGPDAAHMEVHAATAHTNEHPSGLRDIAANPVTNPMLRRHASCPSLAAG